MDTEVASDASAVLPDPLTGASITASVVRLARTVATPLLPRATEDVRRGPSLAVIVVLPRVGETAIHLTRIGVVVH